MVDIESPQLDSTFHALSNPTRRVLIRRLMDGPATVGDLAAPFDMSLAAVSKHLLALEAAGLVKRTIIGRETHCRLSEGRLDAARSLLEEYRSFWVRQLDALDARLDDG